MDSLSEEDSMQGCKDNNFVHIDRFPVEPDVPITAVPGQLRSYSGEFSSLATKTKPDISFFTCLPASSCTKFAESSSEFAMKVLRFFKGSEGKGILVSVAGNLHELAAWTDAG